MAGKNGRPRFRIGMLLNQLEGRYQSSLWKGVADVASEHGVDLVLFAGKSPGTTLADEAQHTVIYKLVDPDRLDGLIVASGVLSNYIGKEGLLKFCEPYRSLPMVSISLELDDVPSVMVDNQAGMQELMEHLVEYHKYRRIAFVRGPETNIEAQQRYEVYCTVLEKHGIEYDPELVVLGNFTREAGVEAVRTLFEQRNIECDVVVSANDDMAVAMFSALKAHGVQVPDQLAMTGFDDIEEMRYLTTPFTTVAQPCYEQARSACQMLLAMLRGEHVSERLTLPTRLVVRQSCGCNVHAESDLSKNEGLPELTAADCARLVQKEKPQIVEDVLLFYDFHEQQKKVYVAQLDFLLELFLSYDNGGFEKFISELKSVLDRQEQPTQFMDFFQNVLARIKQYLLPQVHNLRLRFYYSDLFQKVESHFQSMIMRREAARRMHLEYLFWYLRGVSQDLSLATNFDRLMHVIEVEMMGLGIDNGYLVLYDDDVMLRRQEPWQLPEQATLMMGFEDGVSVTEQRMGERFVTKEMLPASCRNGTSRRTLIIKPLFSRSYHFGYLVFGMSPIEDVVYETLREMVSDALMTALLFRERERTESKLRDALTELEYLNKELHSLSLRDELTSLYNRRGFITLGEQHYNMAARKQEAFLLFFVDLDGLKQINDTYGHDEGDVAIKQAAIVLKKNFRKSDIVARLGGDEFTALAVGNTPDYEAGVRERLQKDLDDYNASSGKPYKLAMSIGVALYDPHASTSFQDLMSEADDKLYQEKRRRKGL